ncbi:MAG: DUF924 domain-containing protein [Alphaproteobacteria bacterium]|nr:DUF924 domain-containing protein [Alphaproteobacteria bacterium]
MTAIHPADIIAFWQSVGYDKWYGKDDAFDAEIRRRFGAIHADAVEGKLEHWALTAQGALALLILLDQFSRNLYRGDARAFAGDAVARTVADAAIAEGFDHQVDPVLRQFFYLPFEHSERMEDQDRSVTLFTALGGKTLPYAIEHRDIIARFGRFPHRNAVLGRTTTPEEQAFLDGGGFKG